jgi:hypothetical protein
MVAMYLLYISRRFNCVRRPFFQMGGANRLRRWDGHRGQMMQVDDRMHLMQAVGLGVDREQIHACRATYGASTFGRQSKQAGKFRGTSALVSSLTPGTWGAYSRPALAPLLLHWLHWLHWLHYD